MWFEVFVWNSQPFIGWLLNLIMWFGHWGSQSTHERFYFFFLLFLSNYLNLKCKQALKKENCVSLAKKRLKLKKKEKEETGNKRKKNKYW